MFQSRGHKRRFTFQCEFEEVFFKCPRLDAPMSQVSKRSDLSFENSGVLKDQMDRKADSLLHKVWDSSAFSLGPAVASTCVVRNLDIWVQRLDDLLASDTPKEEIRESLPLIAKSVAFLADAAADSVKSAARASALFNSAKRAIWLKSLEGDLTSKNKLCGIPFEGKLLFGSSLEEVLARSSENSKRFPSSQRNKPQNKRHFRGFQNKANFKANRQKRNGPLTKTNKKGGSLCVFRSFQKCPVTPVQG